jgi:hypothetical protein
MVVAFIRVLLSGVVDQYPPHGAGRQGEEMRLVGPFDLIELYEAHDGLVDEVACRQ